MPKPRRPDHVHALYAHFQPCEDYVFNDQCDDLAIYEVMGDSVY